jgi:phosphate transport system substrate-binding protein
VGLPLLLNVACLLALLFPPLILLALVVPCSAFRYGRKSVLPEYFLSRYMPFIAPIIYILVVWSIAIFISHGYYTSDLFQKIIWISFAPFFVESGFALIFGGASDLPVFCIVFYLMVILFFALGTRKSGHFAVQGKKRAVYPLVIIFVLVAIVGYQNHERSQRIFGFDRKHPLVQEEINELQYRPFDTNSHLTTLRQQSSIQFNQDYPRLDGSTALFPLYAAAARGIYLNAEARPGNDKRAFAIGFSRTEEAYEQLINGKTDMIFVPAPSIAHQQLAAEKGVTLVLTPLAKEAFVFLVNERNPIQDLSANQIRAIYSGKVNNWNEVGGLNEKIIPFQRPENSGSQTIMLKEVMHDTPLREPLEEEVVRGMGGLVRGVAGYRNFTNALGYSFRYYATQMNPTSGIRLLSINGVAPTPENIRNESYPLTTDVYMVTARPLSENTQKLRDWFLSDEGQQLVEDVGYIPLSSLQERGK